MCWGPISTTCSLPASSAPISPTSGSGWRGSGSASRSPPSLRRGPGCLDLVGGNHGRGGLSRFAESRRCPRGGGRGVDGCAIGAGVLAASLIEVEAATEAARRSRGRASRYCQPSSPSPRDALDFPADRWTDRLDFVTTLSADEAQAAPCSSGPVDLCLAVLGLCSGSTIARSTGARQH